MHRVARPVVTSGLPVDDPFMERSEVLALAARQHGAVAIRQLRNLILTGAVERDPTGAASRPAGVGPSSDAEG